ITGRSSWLSPNRRERFREPPKPKEGGNHENAAVYHSHGRDLRDLHGPGDSREADSAPCRADSDNPARRETGFGRGKDGPRSNQEYQRRGEGDTYEEWFRFWGVRRGLGQVPFPTRWHVCERKLQGVELEERLVRLRGCGLLIPTLGFA